MFMKRKLSDKEFKVMQGIMKVIDTVHPYVPARVKRFGIEPGMTVVDYGCGPGRYAVEFAKLVGGKGSVIAVDVLEIALKETEKKLKKRELTNVDLRLARGYDSGIAKGAADIVCAVDMFHHVEPAPFLAEVRRILKPEGRLIIAGGHLPRKGIKKAVEASGSWELMDEARMFLRYAKK